MTLFSLFSSRETDSPDEKRGRGGKHRFAPISVPRGSERRLIFYFLTDGYCRRRPARTASRARGGARCRPSGLLAPRRRRRSPSRRGTALSRPGRPARPPRALTKSRAYAPRAEPSSRLWSRPRSSSRRTRGTRSRDARFRAAKRPRVTRASRRASALARAVSRFAPRTPRSNPRRLVARLSWFSCSFARAAFPTRHWRFPR